MTMVSFGCRQPTINYPTQIFLNRYLPDSNKSHKGEIACARPSLVDSSVFVGDSERDRLKTDNGWNEKKPLISSGNVTSAPQIEDFMHLLHLNFCFE
ncbi:unnamed protein product [Nesidiocoris tenuis]|uniref:Uncharacterized protein n=1 Tax=Nesidiocoris tenuis TaxID=355587 RepID=A0A6H5FUK2_9HEMI|nr:unnamed protein product [Nesidiocoris tenuis]